MAAGFPVDVGGTRLLTSEALYQACRFPHDPLVQRLIIEERSPMAAKMRSKPFRKDSRPDWDDIRVNVMHWCLRVKLAQNFESFGELLLSTDDKPIVEESRRDAFWGARPQDDGSLVGRNVLGRLLTELREELRAHPSSLREVDPLDIPEFLLLGASIGRVTASDEKSEAPLELFGSDRFTKATARDV